MRGRKGRGHGFRHMLRQAGFKLTRPRDMILQLFVLNPDRHLSAEDLLYLGYQQGMQNLSLATIYRTLEILEKVGLVRRLNINGINKYELLDKKEEEHHHHIICLNCGSVINYSEILDEERELMAQIQRKIEEKFGIEIKRHDLIFYGFCKKCKEEGKK